MVYIIRNNIFSQGNGMGKGIGEEWKTCEDKNSFRNSFRFVYLKRKTDVGYYHQ